MLEELFEELKRYIDAKFEDLKQCQKQQAAHADIVDFKEVAKAIEAQKQSKREVIDIKEAAELTRLSVPSIYRKTHNHEIPFYKRNNKLYFRRSELEQWMTSCRIRTTAEINSDAALRIAMAR